MLYPKIKNENPKDLSLLLNKGKSDIGCPQQFVA